MNTETQEAVKALLDNGKALIHLGKWYLFSNRRDRAIFWFRTALNDCHSETARFWIAWCFANGDGTEKNLALAKQYIQRIINTDAINEIEPEYLYNLAVAIDNGLFTPDCTSRESYDLLCLAAAKKYYNALAWKAVCMVNDTSGWYRDDEEAVRILYSIRNEFNRCDVEARGALVELYTRASRRQIRKYIDEGIYDAELLPESMREPRYWLDGCHLVVKKSRYDSWLDYETRLVDQQKGYYKISIDREKLKMVNECLSEMNSDQLMEYYKSINYNQESQKDIWTMIVMDEEGRIFKPLDALPEENYRSDIRLIPVGGKMSLSNCPSLNTADKSQSGERELKG